MHFYTCLTLREREVWTLCWCVQSERARWEGGHPRPDGSQLHWQPQVKKSLNSAICLLGFMSLFADLSISNLQIARFQRAAVHSEKIQLDSNRLHQLSKLLGCPHEREGHTKISKFQFLLIQYDESTDTASGFYSDAFSLLLLASARLHDRHPRYHPLHT